MLYSIKMDIIKKYSNNKPLVLRFEELKENPYSYLSKISNYTGSRYSKSDISLNVVHGSWSEKQLIFLKSFAVYSKNPPEYYATTKYFTGYFTDPGGFFFIL